MSVSDRARAGGPGLALFLALAGSVQAAAPANRAVIPRDTVVRVRMDEPLSSRSAKRSQTFNVTVAQEDLSGFPRGTRFVGTVTEATPSQKGRPGTLGMKFRTAVLPDGARLPVNGALASLSDEDVTRTSDGRLVSRHGKDSKFDAKWVGYGAGAGLVLAAIFDGKPLQGALFGAVGGAAYSYINQQKAKKASDVRLESGTEFGVRLHDAVAFTRSPRYEFAGRTLPERSRPVRYEQAPPPRQPAYGEPDERASRDRAPERGDARGTLVRIDGREVRFDEDHPVTLDGTLYLPLRAVAREAGMRYEHGPGEDVFTLHTPAGRVRGLAGSRGLTLPDGEVERLGTAPRMVDGQIYVTPDFLECAGMRVTWDREERRVELQTRG